jgi:hypothetical protein
VLLVDSQENSTARAIRNAGYTGTIKSYQRDQQVWQLQVADSQTDQLLPPWVPLQHDIHSHELHRGSYAVLSYDFCGGLGNFFHVVQRLQNDFRFNQLVTSQWVRIFVTAVAIPGASGIQCESYLSMAVLLQ